MIILNTDEVAQKEKRAPKILRVGKYSPRNPGQRGGRLPGDVHPEAGGSGLSGVGRLACYFVDKAIS